MTSGKSTGMPQTRNSAVSKRDFPFNQKLSQNNYLQSLYSTRHSSQCNFSSNRVRLNKPILRGDTKDSSENKATERNRTRKYFPPLKIYLQRCPK
ncbi:hypothetical protein CEXT_490171 [Caerostris extrusa]|uniref:Uncharacterized protein n=1 Tax=Caerostris extrusa TaxID=172846 RepID=A0AAV4PGD0_CAEEX|nr:hypothetical protein CEXT_490171 [Caerostris extrusa]